MDVKIHKTGMDIKHASGVCRRQIDIPRVENQLGRIDDATAHFETLD